MKTFAKKINVNQLLSVLINLHNLGAEYIDLLGSEDSKEGDVQVVIPKIYMSPELQDNFSKIASDETKDIKTKKLTDDDINSLLP